METAASKDVFLVCLRRKKKCVTPHVAVLALAEAGGLAEVLPKDFLPLSFPGQEPQEDRRALPALLLLVLILEPGLCEEALIPRRDHSEPVGLCRNARLRLLERWCCCGGSSGSPVMTRSTNSMRSSHHLAGITFVSSFLGLFHPN